MPETVASFLERVNDAAHLLEEQELLDLIAAAQAHTEVSTLRILIVGAAGSGRCSLANALLGQPRLLPTSPVPKAPVPFEVGYAETVSAELVAKDGSKKMLSTDRLRAFLTSPETQANDYRQVELKANSDLLKSASFRVESIGASRSPAAWKEMLAGIDYVFFTLKAVALLSEEERTFIEEILHPSVGLERVTIVINQIDLIDQEERPELTERLRAFLGPFERQPAIIEFSAARISQDDDEDSALDSGYEALIRIARSDLIDHHQTTRAAALRQAAELCLAALEETVTRQQALAATSEADVKDLLGKIDARQQWLPARVERVQHRVETFINAMLRDQFLQEIEGFSAALQQQLPLELQPVQDMTALKRYLPGYIESLWKEFFNRQLDGVRSKLAAEVKQINQMIEDDFRELLESQGTGFQDNVRDFGDSPDHLRTLLMPRRGKNQAGTVATGIQVVGLVLLIPNLPLGLAAIGIGQVVRMVFKKDTDASDRQALIDSAVHAVGELELQIKKQVSSRFDAISEEMKKAVADRYEQGLSRIRSLLEESLAWRDTLATKQAHLSTLREQTIPELRGLLAQLDELEGAA
jgi:predicted GTPase